MNTTVTSSELAEQVVEIVHLKTYKEPTVPENNELLCTAFENEPVPPDRIVHNPAPEEGVFAASVTFVKPHVASVVWSGPALDSVGLLLKVIETSSKLPVQGKLETDHRRI